MLDTLQEIKCHRCSENPKYEVSVKRGFWGLQRKKLSLCEHCFGDLLYWNANIVKRVERLAQFFLT